jgi:heme/copper-type cytochrome/quinol oxidase subunit 1
MAMTETRPAPESAPAEVQVPATALVPPPDRPGLAGWLTTSDHKRIGRLYVATALLLGLVATGVGTVLAAEEVRSGFGLVGARTFLQLFTLHQEAAVWLFVVPLLLGLATFVVPLQVGSPEIAFPRGAATAYWTYLVGAGLLLAAYLTDGGPAGDTGAAVDLHLVALAALLSALVLGMICVATTALTLRAPGMTLERVPAFTWSMVLTAGLTLFSAPVLVARVVVLYVTHHFGGAYGINDYGALAWAYAVPQLYLVAVPAAGVAFEVVQVLARDRRRRHGTVLVVLSLLGVVSVGAWAEIPATFDDLLFVALGLVAVLPALAIVGLVGDTLRNGRPELRAPLLLAGGSVLLLLAGTVTGALSVISGLDLLGTAWQSAVLHLVVFGAAGLGALAGIWWWAPKLYGRPLSEGAGVLALLAVLVGTVLLAVPDLVNGLSKDVPLRPGASSPAGYVGLNVLAVIGAALVFLGLLVTILAIARAGLVRPTGGHSATGGQSATGDDPWGGHTLEWATSSPPAPANFPEPVGPVRSATPLLDETEA